MRKLYEENEELRHALHNAQNHQQPLPHLHTQKDLEEALEQSRLQLVNLSGENEALREAIAELNAVLHRLEEEFGQLRNYAAQLEGQVAVRDEELAKLRAVPNNQAEVQQLKRQAVELEEANSELRGQLAQGGLKAVQTGQTVDKETQQLKAKFADLQQAYAKLSQQLSQQPPQDDS
jgi:predicted nuclease with TOPRIM domain